MPILAMERDHCDIPFRKKTWPLIISVSLKEGEAQTVSLFQIPLNSGCRYLDSDLNISVQSYVCFEPEHVFRNVYSLSNSERASNKCSELKLFRDWALGLTQILRVGKMWLQSKRRDCILFDHYCTITQSSMCNLLLPRALFGASCSCALPIITLSKVDFSVSHCHVSCTQRWAEFGQNVLKPCLPKRFGIIRQDWFKIKKVQFV